MITKIKNKIELLFSNIKNSFLNNKIKYIVLIAIWVVTVFLSLNLYQTSLGCKSYGNDNYNVEVYEINKDTKIIENIPVKDDSCSISFKFATYARENKGNVYIKVEGDNSSVIYLDEKINVSTLQDNSFATYGLSQNIDSSKDNRVTITITSDSEKNECAGIYYSIDRAFNQSTLSVNGYDQPGDIKVRLLIKNEVLLGFTKTFLTFTIIGISILILMLLIDTKKEILFTTIALVLGLIFMTLITPMSPPDEQAHYEFSFQLSNYILGNDYEMIEREYQDYSSFSGHENVSTAYEALVNRLNEKLELSGKFNEMENDVHETTYVLCYFPQVLGVLIGRLTKLNMLKTFYLGRFCNLIFYCICLYIAIKKTPIHKTMFGLISITPIFIQQAASYSYDTFLNGLMLILISFFLNWLFKEDGVVSKKEIIQLLIVLLFLTPCKKVYSLFVLAFWLIPYDKFGSKKRKTASVLVITLPVVISVIGLVLPSIKSLLENFAKNSKVYADATDQTAELITSSEIIEEVEDESNKLYSIGYITRNLSKTINLFIVTIRNNIKIWFYESIGRTLSGVTIILPLTVIHLITIILVLAGFIKEPYSLSISTKIVFVVISIGIGLLIMAGMLLTWTTRGDTFIQGIQGRYFSPLLYYVFTIFNNKKIYLPEKISSYLIYSQLLITFEVILYVLSFTFVN